jgi:hypothetical protein
MSLGQQEKIDKQLNEYDSLMAKSRSELDTLVHDINIRVKVLEVDLGAGGLLDDDEYAEERRQRIEQGESSLKDGFSGSNASPLRQ